LVPIILLLVAEVTDGWVAEVFMVASLIGWVLVYKTYRKAPSGK
jgi:hypothetical protein